jgi:hypothetical protein
MIAYFDDVNRHAAVSVGVTVLGMMLVIISAVAQGKRKK